MTTFHAEKQTGEEMFTWGLPTLMRDSAVGSDEGCGSRYTLNRVLQVALGLRRFTITSVLKTEGQKYQETIIQILKNAQL